MQPLEQACPFCGTSGEAEAIVLTERFFGVGDRFLYLICANCGSLYIADPSIDVSAYYPSNYYSYAAGDRPGILGHLDRRARQSSARSHLATLESAGARFSTSSRIYDVGSGSGALLRTLREFGFLQISGIDPYLAAGVDTNGIELLRAPLEVVASERHGTADLIMFHHSLEHFPDPTATLRHAATLLAPNGWLLVRLPIVNYAWEKYRDKWFGLDAPRHLAIPTYSGMLQSAERAGFRVVFTTFDSTAQQFTASNAYARNQSFIEAFPASPLRTLFHMVGSIGYEAEARRLNAQERGDQAAFVLRPASAGD